jgi:hypothetical protein
MLYFSIYLISSVITHQRWIRNVPEHDLISLFQVTRPPLFFRDNDGKIGGVDHLRNKLLALFITDINA